ncbi:polyprenyl synthetase family protein [Halomonas sp. McH1-25]|uniref:polyprenyl synthetase family protein n=1 Tax=unclassified Halomonas TaxID=2609666 RepID=UPI001EF60B52|nr:MULTISPECIES: polyprenyl synthetase family protein [unclassified Halomonas]MCG7599293.1 polyprenyl synthetase family protein [Halomonas sp. McH1-25]MCP1341161.1 polyprenyl synthetase family protein [Halomonas sp. FL8]MCP1363446.1 polyprenyl synthetase family protein [Halomonas sp. BBD45]
MGSISHRPDSVNEAANEFSDLRRQIDARLEQLLPRQAGDPITLAMRDCLLSGGKRVRPCLLILAARGVGGDSPALLDLGCAVEMIHSASLILDDLPCMDDASLRRGRPTTHRQYGEDVAMLAMVALLSRAFGLVSQAPGISPETCAQMVMQLSRAVGDQGLVRGQYQDLHASRQLRSVDDVSTTNTLKTGVLFQATLALAGLAAGADEPTASRLQRFALVLGQAYQLYDDLTDGLAVNGKDVDQDDGKTTLVALLGEAEVRQRLAGHLAEADRHLVAVFGDDPPLSRFVHDLFSRFDNELGALRSTEAIAFPLSRL